MTLLILKDEKAITLKAISLSDVDNRHAFWVQLSDEQNGMVHTPHEINIHTHESFENIQDFLSNKRGLWLVALNEHQEIIGEIDIRVKPLERIKHVGQLSIGILEAYQNIALGSALMQEALSWARENNLKRIELFVFMSNIKAQNLYKKFGFVTEGIRKNFLCVSNNSYEDDILMAAYL